MSEPTLESESEADDESEIPDGDVDPEDSDVVDAVESSVEDADAEESASSTSGGEDDFDVEDEPETADATIEEDDIDPNSLFSGVDDAADDDTGGSESTGESGGGSTPQTDAIEDAVNEGFARLATVDWPEEADSDAEEMEEEFKDVFEAFRLGHFGERCADEYIFAEDDEVDPFWGFSGSMVIAAAFVVMMRPDGEEKVASLADGIRSFTA